MHLNYALSYYERFIHACCVHTFFDLVSINQNVTTHIQICLHSINRWIEPLEKMDSPSCPSFHFWCGTNDPLLLLFTSELTRTLFYKFGLIETDLNLLTLLHIPGLYCILLQRINFFCNLSLKYNNFLPQKQLLFLAQIKMGCGALTRWLLSSIDNVCGIMSVTMENNSVYQYNKKNKIYTPKKVKVFPALVIPYVKTREFCPSSTSLTRPFTVPSNISFCVVSGP